MIIGFLADLGRDASIGEIAEAVEGRIGRTSQSSIRSYLRLNVPSVFERCGRGRYRLSRQAQYKPVNPLLQFRPVLERQKAKLFHADSLDWLASQEPCSIHAVVTDPPYGLVEYSTAQQDKLRKGRGGVWRVPPAYDGHKRSPLPRFTVLDATDRNELFDFFKRFGRLLGRVVVPGANVIIASNPLLAHIVTAAMVDAGFEARGNVIRLTMTMRGGDRPKNAHVEFDDVSVMPRSMWEPWIILRRPLEGRVQDNLRRWKTGGFRRISGERPFGDVIQSSPTSKQERKIAPHPSLKPQDFLRKMVRASLPLGEGVVLDPFAGSGSTLAAANVVEYESIGVERDRSYVQLAASAIPLLELIPGKKDPV
ncbi:site-specific DNA-methyltransferase [Dongia sp.]|uniref:DNA-methyltransferase n=1 Tax=Dongia sp. TaxID=1977262 RepID=UPI0035B22850